MITIKLECTVPSWYYSHRLEFNEINVLFYLKYQFVIKNSIQVHKKITWSKQLLKSISNKSAVKHGHQKYEEFELSTNVCFTIF